MEVQLAATRRPQPWQPRRSGIPLLRTPRSRASAGTQCQPPQASFALNARINLCFDWSWRLLTKGKQNLVDWTGNSRGK